MKSNAADSVKTYDKFETKSQRVTRKRTKLESQRIAAGQDEQETTWNEDCCECEECQDSDRIEYFLCCCWLWKTDWCKSNAVPCINCSCVLLFMPILFICRFGMFIGNGCETCYYEGPNGMCNSFLYLAQGILAILKNAWENAISGFRV